MAQHVTLNIKVEPLGYRVGLWCQRCALPSAVRAHVAVTTAGRTSLLTRDQCTDCGSHDVTEAHE